MGATRKQTAKAPGLPEQFATLCKNLGVEFKTLPNGEPDIYDWLTWAHIGVELGLRRPEFRPNRHGGRRRGRRRDEVDLKILAYATEQHNSRGKSFEYWLKKGIQTAEIKEELPPRDRTTHVKRLRNLQMELDDEKNQLRLRLTKVSLEGAPKLSSPAQPPETVGLLGPLGARLGAKVHS